MSLQAPPRTSSRTRREPYKPEAHVAAVIKYWREYAPKTDDNALEIDDLAEAITPSDSRNCAAIYLRPKAGVPLVAMNDWNSHLVEGGGADQHPVIYAAGDYERAKSTIPQLHAEMKILQFGYANRAFGAKDYIGISKPCCLRCAVVMKMLGFKARGNSGGLWAAGWAIPPFVAAEPGRLKVFMGEDEYAWYEQLPESDQEDFLRRLQTAKD